MFKTLLCVLSIFMFVLTPATETLADGNVIVEVNDDGDLRVTGQNNTNQCILVQSLDVGVLRFFNFDMDSGITTYNGEETLEVGNVFGDMRFDLKSGPKALMLLGDAGTELHVFGNLRITSTGSDNVIILTNIMEVDGRTDIKSKNGHDAIVLLQSVFNDRVRVNSGNGDDVVGTSGFSVFLGDTQFQTGGGSDFVSVTNSMMLMELDVKTGSGDDSVGFLFNTFAMNVQVNGNGGFDSFAAQNLNLEAGLIQKSIELESNDYADVGPSALVIETLQLAADIALALGF